LTVGGCYCDGGGLQGFQWVLRDRLWEEGGERMKRGERGEEALRV